MSRPKVLFVASVAGHFHAFHRPYFKFLHDQGYEVHVACRGEFADPCVSKVFDLPFVRSPFSWSHLGAYRALRQVVDKGGYSLITCHTPMASVITRLAARSARRRGTRVVYMAHGFHFYDGCGLAGWAFYYPVELALTHMSDAVICINNEDYQRIGKRGAAGVGYHLVPGIGVDAGRFRCVSPQERKSLRVKHGVPQESFVLAYAAEFIHRKNHEMVIEVVERLKNDIPGLMVVLVGRGELLEKTKADVARRGLEGNVRFLGFVDNVEEFYQLADVAISTSRQEGLGLNLVEAMMCGCPVIATLDRGHRTVIEHGVGGVLTPQEDADAFAKQVSVMYHDSRMRHRMRSEATARASKFELGNVLAAIGGIYVQYLEAASQGNTRAT